MRTTNSNRKNFPLLRVLAPAGAVLLLLFATGSASGRGPARALVYEAEGKIVPPVSAYEELEAGTVLELAPSAIIEALHYESCETLRAEGGQFRVGEKRFQLSGGRILDLKRASCPPRLQISGKKRMAGLLLRNIGPGLGSGRQPLRPRPQLRIAGPGRPELQEIRISTATQPATRLEMDGDLARWPTMNAALQPGSDCLIHVIGKHDVEQTLKCRIVPSAPDAALILVE